MVDPGLLPLYTDLYQLTMAQAWFRAGRGDVPATYNWLFRTQPFDSGYVVFAGTGDLVELLESMHFGNEALGWLRAHGFDEAFVDWLRGWRFRGSIESVAEGEVVFPGAPAMQVHGTLIDAQLIETLLLNTINFQSLIATKAARVVHAAGPTRSVLDFGLRRAQGWGAVAASRAAAIGGVVSTSNVLAGYRYGLDVTGTMAHAWVQSFDDELDAFRRFVEVYPDGAVLLVDTWNTLSSGVPNAITVARELAARGHRLGGVRLDSGDLAYLSKKVRRMLDEAGLDYVRIAVSNALDEHLIKSLLEQGARVDAFGVGTRMITAADDPALDGVYKLVASDGRPRMKVSDNVTKATLPGAKRLERYSDETGAFVGDGVSLADEPLPERIVHPVFAEKSFSPVGLQREGLLQPLIADGVRVRDLPSVREACAYRAERMAKLPEEHLRFANPHVYRVGISERLHALRAELRSVGR
jgi:nicotinate phosphoribosyltransferase